VEVCKDSDKSGDGDDVTIFQGVPGTPGMNGKPGLRGVSGDKVSQKSAYDQRTGLFAAAANDDK